MEPVSFRGHMTNDHNIIELGLKKLQLAYAV